jgi:hypothetical protein
MGDIPPATVETKFHLRTLPSSEIIGSEARKGCIEAYEQKI